MRSTSSAATPPPSASTNVNAVLPDDVPDDVAFRTIRSNPPIRVGKNELHGLLERWIPRLDERSDAWLVVQRNLGSDSLQRWLAATFDHGYSVHRAATGRGFRVPQGAAARSRRRRGSHPARPSSDAESRRAAGRGSHFGAKGCRPRQASATSPE